MILIKNPQILAVVLLIVGLAAGFFGGMQYQKSQAPARGAGRGAFAQRFGQNGQNSSVVAGQILSIDSGSITVKLRDGSSKIVLLPGSATISKSTTGSKSDLQVGSNVAAFGTANSDGSITATSVSLNPTISFGGGGGRGTGQPTSSSSGNNGSQAY